MADTIVDTMNRIDGSVSISRRGEQVEVGRRELTERGSHLIRNAVKEPALDRDDKPAPESSRPLSERR